MPWPVDQERYLAFLSIMLAMALMPGPAILFAVASGMTRGVRGVLLATLGMTLASLGWFVGSALGLVIIAATLPWLFRLAGAVGVVYIAWLGIDALRGALREAAPPPRSLRAPGLSVFRDGFLVQASNPKALLFFSAVLPPLVALDRPVVPQLAAFSLGFFAIDILVMIGYGMLGATFARKMDEPGFRRLFGGFVGLVLLGVAALMARRLF